MESIGPIVGMVLIGLVAGWLLCRLCIKATRLALLAIVVFVGLELIGYKIATEHWQAISSGAGAAAHSAAETAKSSRDVLWRLATYNIPFTVAFAFGFYKALPLRRRR